jgi:hypothetical protein
MCLRRPTDISSMRGARFRRSSLPPCPDDVDRGRARNDGVVCYLRKPVDGKHLIGCPHQALHSGEPTEEIHELLFRVRQYEIEIRRFEVHSPLPYLGNGDPALAGYYSAWLDNLADDATVEGSLLDGAVRGAKAVRSIVVTIRSLYDHQEHKFAGPYGDNGFLEDYVAGVLGEPIGCVVLVTRNAAGQTQHVVASYRPRSSLLLLSRLLHEKFASPPYGEQLAGSES